MPKVAGLLIDRWRSLVKAASKNLHDLQFKKWIGNNDSGWPPIKCRQKLKAAITILEAGNNNSGWLPLLGGANSSRIALQPNLKPQHSPISKWWWGLVICNTTWVVGWGRDISSGLNILDIFDIVSAGFYFFYLFWWEGLGQHYQSSGILLLLIVVFFFFLTSTFWWKGSGSAGEISKVLRNCFFGAVGVGETTWAVLKMVLV